MIYVKDNSGGYQMSSKVVTISSVTAGILLFSVGLPAHHGASTSHDLTLSVNVAGTVTDFQFVNPHVLIFFDVTGEDGVVVEWWAGLGAPNRLTRGDGWTDDTLKPGDQISVTGAPARGGVPSMWAEQVLLDGKPLLVNLANWRQLLEIGVR
jgi:hypothetical protein